MRWRKLLSSWREGDGLWRMGLHGRRGAGEPIAQECHLSTCLLYPGAGVESRKNAPPRNRPFLEGNKRGGEEVLAIACSPRHLAVSSDLSVWLLGLWVFSLGVI